MVENFTDDDLIDYDEEHYMYDRNRTKFTQKELEREFASHSQRIWEFLAQKVILRD